MAPPRKSDRRETRAGPFSEIARQAARLLLVLAGLDVLVRRAAAGSLGLRLSMDHPILSSWTAFGDRAGELPTDALLVGSLVVIAAALPLLLARRQAPALVAGTACAALGLQALLHRITPGETGAPASLIIGLLLLAAAGLCPACRASWSGRTTLLAAAGAGICSLWKAGTSLDLQPLLLETLESTGEALLVIAVASAHLFRRAGARRGWILFAVTTGTTGLVFVSWTDASLHVVRHLLHLGQAGLPAWLLGTGLALALGSLARLACQGPQGRWQALLLALLLASARGPGVELDALRLALVALIVLDPGSLPAWQPGPVRSSRGGG